jgi:lysophospholipase L1-like esterase
MRSTHAFLAIALLLTGAFITIRPTSAQPSAAPAAAPATSPATSAATRPTGRARWEKEIAAYEAADRANPPARGGIVFTGSSTIRGWKTLASDFPEHNVINRGFGGSQIVDATHFADRIIIPYAPRMVILRAGGNDIHGGKSAERVFADYQAFVAKVRAALPDAEIVYISMCPAPVRWDERDTNKRANALIEEFSKRTPGLKYVETYDMSVNPDGTAREELFVKDRLHFNEAGYKILADLVRPALGTATKR